MTDGCMYFFFVFGAPALIQVIAFVFILGFQLKEAEAKPKWISDQFEAIRDDEVRSTLSGLIYKRKSFSPLTVGEFGEHHRHARELVANRNILQSQLSSTPHLIEA